MATVPLPGVGDLPGNSQTQKQQVAKAAAENTPGERPTISKIVTGEAVERKKGLWSRIGESFTGDDARSVVNFVVMDVVVPSAKSLISDALTTAVERFFFGDGRVSRPSNARGGTSYGQYTPYNRVSSNGSAPWSPQPQPQQMSRRGRATHDFREILIPNRAEAGIVLDTLTQMADMYEVATVADLYDATGMTSEYTDRNWGWNALDLRDASVVRVRDGYIVRLPPPSAIK